MLQIRDKINHNNRKESGNRDLQKVGGSGKQGVLKTGPSCIMYVPTLQDDFKLHELKI